MMAGLLALQCGAPGCGPSPTSATAPAPEQLATGRCLGRLCLGMTESAALAAIDGAGGTAGAGGRRCFHLEDADLDLSFEVDAADAGRAIRSILVTTIPHCPPVGGDHRGTGGAAAVGGALPVEGAPPVGGGMPVGGAGRILDCRGLRPGDPESFATKMHRRAVPIAAAAEPWSTAPAGVRGLEDVCDPAAAGAARAGLYLRDGRVVGLAVWKP